MIVTSTELQNNFGKYINIIQKETVAFTKNGKMVGKMVAVKKDKREAFENLEKLKQGLHDVTEEQHVAERAEKYNV
jgi:antitoxin (DNA-binding transcriptional repressor) of toxin-antitoxin stability system